MLLRCVVSMSRLTLSDPSDREACDQNIWERTDKAVARWKRLTERRRNHLLELYRSGRWRHYYENEDALARELRNVARGIEGFRSLLPPELAGTMTTLAPESSPAGNEASSLAPEAGNAQSAVQDDAEDIPEFIPGDHPSRP